MAGPCSSTSLHAPRGGSPPVSLFYFDDLLLYVDNFCETNGLQRQFQAQFLDLNIPSIVSYVISPIGELVFC